MLKTINSDQETYLQRVRRVLPGRTSEQGQVYAAGERYVRERISQR